MAEQLSFFNSGYDDFVEKFKSKKTTDDCYTPPMVYDAILGWAVEEYGFSPEQVVRPFMPGGDFENFRYPDGCVVLDNPPFSILSKIVDFYISRNIKFFLFAPSLTAFSRKKNVMKINHIIGDHEIVYENGAAVKTAFVTNLSDGIIAQTAPELSARIDTAMHEVLKSTKKELPKYSYSPNILTAAMLQKLGRYGVDYKLKACDCVPISALDSQRAEGKAIFGSGLLLSEKAAAEKAAAEKAAAEKAAAEKAAAIEWPLSDREIAIIEKIGGGG